MLPRHQIFTAVLDGQYARGLDLHSTLPHPTPDDDRWAGYCHYALGRYDHARDLLLRAKGGGCAAASLELSTVWRALGDARAARDELDHLDLTALAPLDRASAHRELGAVRLYDGHLRDARTHLEQAWRLVTELGEAGAPLAPQAALLLGYVNHLQGRDAAARHALDVAVNLTRDVRGVQPLMTRAHASLYGGRYDAAERDLREAEALLERAPGARAYHAYLRGLLHRARGEWLHALAAFDTATREARTAGEISTEFTAHLGLATIRTARHELRAAEGHLRRASRLAGNDWERALLALREGYWQGVRGDPRATRTLEAARDAFVRLDLPRETSWADLHLADVHAVRDRDAALAAVRRAVNGRHDLGSGAPLLPELRLLPHLTALLAEEATDEDAAVLLNDRRAALGAEPLRVTLVTLGESRLLADGQDVRLGMRRTVELLAYLLTRGSASRDQILTALWPDDDPLRSKNYLHQVNHVLRKVTPYLCVAHDVTSGTYTVTCTGPTFHWDAEDVKRLLSSDDEDDVMRALTSYTGPFLPAVESDWAREERDALTNAVITVGLKLMARWSAQGEYSKSRALAQRLLSVDPCDESLVEYLVEATLHLEGELAAKRALLAASERAERELNVPPDWVDRVARRVRLVN